MALFNAALLAVAAVMGAILPGLSTAAGFDFLHKLAYLHAHHPAAFVHFAKSFHPVVVKPVDVCLLDIDAPVVKVTRDYKVLVKPDFPKCHEPAVGLYIKCDNGYTSEEFAVPDWTTFAPGKAKVCELEYTTFCECGTSKTKKVIVELDAKKEVEVVFDVKKVIVVDVPLFSLSYKNFLTYTYGFLDAFADEEDVGAVGQINAIAGGSGSNAINQALGGR